MNKNNNIDNDSKEQEIYDTLRGAKESLSVWISSHENDVSLHSFKIWVDVLELSATCWKNNKKLEAILLKDIADRLNPWSNNSMKEQDWIDVDKIVVLRTEHKRAASAYRNLLAYIDDRKHQPNPCDIKYLKERTEALESQICAHLNLLSRRNSGR